MQITTAFLSLLSAAAVSAKCYLGESSWVDSDEAAWHAMRACRGYDGNQGAFQGWFAPGETRHVCVDSKYGGGRKFDFSIQNQNQRDGFDLDDGDCEAHLVREIRACANGGEHTEAGWWFKSDPNLYGCR